MAISPRANSGGREEAGSLAQAMQSGRPSWTHMSASTPHGDRHPTAPLFHNLSWPFPRPSLNAPTSSLLSSPTSTKARSTASASSALITRLRWGHT